ncbi:MAG: hypothetical protein IKY94_10930 [Lachnospiraceae bacterium]|nr:hypothetical protein [Lachnospiraceae bacterium]
MKRFKTPRGAFFLLLAMGCVLLAYYLINLRIEKSKPEDYVQLTAVQEVLSRNLTTNYPQTPKEVIKYYSEITKCFYNEECTEEELYALAMKAQELYDHDLVANKTEEQYLYDLKSEIQAFKEKDYYISSYGTSSSTDVYDFTEDGYEFARLYCTYNIRVGTVIQPIEEVFLLRMDLEGHWKIYGWDLAENHKQLQGGAQ